MEIARIVRIHIRVDAILEGLANLPYRDSISVVVISENYSAKVFTKASIPQQ